MKNPFENWDSFNPSHEIEKWREMYESDILKAIDSENRLSEINSLLSNDQQSFCDDCEAMKCYGSLYPICELAMEKMRAIIQGK